MKPLLVILLFINSIALNAQNIFPVKVERCKADRFCLDCGDIKVGYNQADFDKLLHRLNRSLTLYGLSGNIKFQVLVDSKGRGCVLSHTDQTNNPITEMIILELNNFDKWTPAITNNVKEEKSSVNVLFTISDNIISGKIDRVDIKAFKKSFDRPLDPEIFNKHFTYTNPSLDSYEITVWNSSNSNLPNNFNDDITIDKDGLIWMSVDEGLVTFDGKSFTDAGQNITDKGKYFGYGAIETDNDNTKWVFGKMDVYSFSNGTWKRYLPEESGIDGGYDIINNPGTGEVFFCGDEGLIIFKDGAWSTINQTTHKNLPGNRVRFARRDSKNRLWIGTYEGSGFIGNDNIFNSFQDGKTVLKGKCILSMDEDEAGNLYFSVYENNRKDKENRNADEGLIIMKADGTIIQLTTDNSGIPANCTSQVRYDEHEKVLWIISNMSGLVRYDLKDGWENYHNLNSGIPTAFLTDMAFDSAGNLFITSRQGLIRIMKKK